MDFESALGKDYASLVHAGALPTPREEEKIDSETYATFPQHGVSLVVDGSRVVSSVQYYGVPQDEIARFDGSLPAGLDFNMGRDAARTTLGQPEKSGEGSVSGFLGRKPPWDRWVAGTAFIHAEYDFAGETIGLVSLIDIASNPHLA